MMSLIRVVIAYPQFVADFFLLRGLTEYELQGTMSANLIYFFLGGLALAVLLGIIGSPDAEPIHESDPRVRPTPSSPPARRFSEDILRLTIVLIGGSLILHTLMLLYSNLVVEVPIGNVLDTINAALGYGSVYLPIHALLTRIHQRIATRNRQRDTKGTRPITIALGIFQFLFPIFFLISLSQVYGTPVHTIVSPVLVSAVGTIVAVTGTVAIVLLLLRGNPPVQG